MGVHLVASGLFSLVVCSVLSLLGRAFGGELALLPACCPNNTLGSYNNCSAAFPSPDFRLWPDHPIKYDAPISCANHYQFKQGLLYFDDDGTLELRELDMPSSDMCSIGLGWAKYDRSNYCLDYDVTSNNTVAHICLTASEMQEIPLVQKVCSAVSAVLLLITIAIYSLNKNLKKWSVGAYLISQSISLASAFICLARLQFSPEVGNYSECLVAGYCLQYFFMAAFFWMNAHCVIIYLMISQLRPESRSPAHDEMRKKRFILASVYAWGIPFVICLTTFVLQYYDLIPDRRFRPDMGCVTCFLLGWKVKWIYFYAPMAVLVIVNIVLFTLSFTCLMRHKISSGMLRTSQTRMQRELWYYKQYLKLFILTGLSWAGEVIGYTFKTQDDLDTWKDSLWLGLDVFNCLQGVFMFTMFVCPKEIRRYYRWLPRWFQHCFHLSKRCFTGYRHLQI